MKAEDAKKLPKYTPNPIFKGMPKHLKDPKNYPKIHRAILETLASTHSHAEMQDWAKCFSCRLKLRDHREMVRKLGFKSPEQYMAWGKVMNIIHNPKRDPLR